MWLPFRNILVTGYCLLLLIIKKVSRMLMPRILTIEVNLASMSFTKNESMTAEDRRYQKHLQTNGGSQAVLLRFN